jgi:C1A family cysteine protease
VWRSPTAVACLLLEGAGGSDPTTGAEGTCRFFPSRCVLTLGGCASLAVVTHEPNRESTMITLTEKRPALSLAPRTKVTRRSFINGTATLTGGVAAGRFFLSPVLAAAPPTDFDLRTPGYITSVKNQDLPSPCNACTAFGVVATVEGTYNKKNNSLGNQGPDLDEMDLFTHAPPPPGPSGGCATSHWWPKYALAYCQTIGLKWEGSSNPRIKIDPPTPLLDDNNLNKTQSNIKDWIYNKGPVVAVMVQYEDFFNFGDSWFKQNGNTPNPDVYSPGKHTPPGPIVGGHVVSVVGYKGNDYWICKNSWGRDWNGDGFFQVAQGKQNGIGETYIDRIDVWGVTVQ